MLSILLIILAIIIFIVLLPVIVQLAMVTFVLGTRLLVGFGSFGLLLFAVFALKMILIGGN